MQTYQQSLKYLLEQKVGTPLQQKWITKLLGFDLSVEYNQGKDNRVADTLSRKVGSKEGELAPSRFQQLLGWTLSRLPMEMI